MIRPKDVFTMCENTSFGMGVAFLTCRLYAFLCARNAWISGQSLFKDIFVFSEVFPFGPFSIGNPIAAFYGICLRARELTL